jgi:hypothetical protein
VKPATATLTVAVALALVGLGAASLAGGAQTAQRIGLATRAVAPPPLAAAAARVRAELRGIPQNGLVLGSTSAGVSIFEYADLICKPCTLASNAIVKPVIKRFVRTGDASLQFEPIVEGPRSDQFALGAFAAGTQHRGWNYTQLAYLRCTASSDGPVGTPAQLARSLGVNLRRWRASLSRRQWPRTIEQAARVALLGGFIGYPVFIVRATANFFDTNRITVLRAPVTLAELSKAVRRAILYART